MPTLRELRDAQALAQRDLAERAGVSKTTVQAIEAGHGPVRPSTRRKLAVALGVAPAAIDWPRGQEAGDGA